jgi:PPM family protein phosphatase
MQIGFKTDPGIIRKHNEDEILVDEGTGLFIVADGMGGHEAGELASSITVVEIADHVRKEVGGGKATKAVLEEAIFHANAEIIGSAPIHIDGSEIGSPVVLALVNPNSVHVAHLGDSRAYMITNGKMKQLTNDHTFVADALRQGWITPVEARTHDARHGLYSALGVDDDMEIQI